MVMIQRTQQVLIGRAGDILQYARESLMQKIQPIVSMRLTCIPRHYTTTIQYSASSTRKHEEFYRVPYLYQLDGKTTMSSFHSSIYYTSPEAHHVIGAVNPAHTLQAVRNCHSKWPSMCNTSMPRPLLLLLQTNLGIYSPCIILL